MKYCEQLMWATTVLLFVIGSAGNIDAQSVKGNNKYETGDLDRQNKITQEILAKYLQRRLFPHLVYPRGLDGSALAKSLQKAGILARADSDQSDTLETVESERISNFHLFGDDLQALDSNDSASKFLKSAYVKVPDCCPD